MSNLVLYAGDERPLEWPVTDSDGQPLDVTTWEAHAQVRPFPNSPDVLHEWSLAQGNVVMGEGTITLLVDDSAEWLWTVGEYDLFLTDGKHHTERIDGGRIRVIPRVTHG